jgi:hypothetical protein
MTLPSASCQTACGMQTRERASAQRCFRIVECAAAGGSCKRSAEHSYAVQQCTNAHRGMQDDMLRVVGELDKPDADKAAAHPLFQWRLLRRIARADLSVYAAAVQRPGAQQVEFAACKLTPEDDRAQARTLTAACNIAGAAFVHALCGLTEA